MARIPRMFQSARIMMAGLEASVEFAHEVIGVITTGPSTVRPTVVTRMERHLVQMVALVTYLKQAPP